MMTQYVQEIASILRATICICLSTQPTNVDAVVSGQDTLSERHLNNMFNAARAGYEKRYRQCMTGRPQ